MRATVVGLTAGHCTYAELRAMVWRAVTDVACTPTVYGNQLANYSLIRK